MTKYIPNNMLLFSLQTKVCLHVDLIVNDKRCCGTIKITIELLRTKLLCRLLLCLCSILVIVCCSTVGQNCFFYLAQYNYLNPCRSKFDWQINFENFASFGSLPPLLLLDLRLPLGSSFSAQICILQDFLF